MLLAGQRIESRALSIDDVHGVRLRVRGGGIAHEIVPLRIGKTTIGSSPRCDLRVQQPGVRPVHLVINQGPDGLFVRSWANDSELNGAPLQESPLKSGDRLSFAAVDIEIEGMDRANGQRETQVSYRQLADRVDGLESLMEAALLEPENRQEHIAPKLPSSSAAADDRQALPLSDASNPTVQKMGALEAEIENLKCRLAEAERSIADSEQRRDLLEQERAQWLADRDEWAARHAELQVLLVASESRANEHARRSEQLEQDHLEPASSEHSPADAEWSMSGTVSPSESTETSPNEFSRGASWSDSQADAGQPPSADTPAALPAATENEWPSLPDPDDASLTVPRSQTSAPMGEFSWPAPASDVPSEPEDEYAPFAEFSIWNQGAQSEISKDTGQLASSAAWESETGVAGESRAASAEQQPWAAPEPAEPNTAAPTHESRTSSFIERYAHMFADDDSVGEPVQSATTHPPDEDGLIRKPRAFGGSAPVGQSLDSSEDEESIEQYMAKLMQRVRGERPHAVTSYSEVAAAPEAATVTNHAEPDDLTADTHNRAHSSSTAGAPTSPDSGKEEYLTTSLGTVRRKSVTMERPANLEAFRALANESARRAISTHAHHKHRRDAITKAIVATLAGMTSLFVMLEAPSWLDMQFITAGVTLLIAAYWAGQAFGTRAQSLRAAAYDGPEELLENLIDPFRPALPIDVERNKRLE